MFQQPVKAAWRELQLLDPGRAGRADGVFPIRPDRVKKRAKFCLHEKGQHKCLRVKQFGRFFWRISGPICARAWKPNI